MSDPTDPVEPEAGWLPAGSADMTPEEIAEAAADREFYNLQAVLKVADDGEAQVILERMRDLI